jgi:alkanesulfonate monooxygenase SsuD/methylene tetrahydromethanopterin reductase-like flavin-dependent oxidoreductase (luciferase family)
MSDYVANLSAAAKQAGRPHPRAFFGVQPFIGGTEEEALRRISELEERVPMGTALNRLGGLLGRTFTEDELGHPIAISETEASQGWMTAIAHVNEGRPATLREMALHFAISPMNPRIVGTPEQVADTLEEWWRDTGCYGFTIVPEVLPASIEGFAEEVVPLLQKRGIMRTEYAGTTYRENLLQQ